ncbi:MAG: hypothetical protein ACI9Y7_003139, partial [Dokdonia sp.]
PRTERYERKTSDEIVIEVMNGPVDSNLENTTVTSDNTNKQQVIAADKQFAYIKSTPNLQSVSKKQFFKSGLFWALLGGPFLLIPIAMIVRKRRQAYTSDVQGSRIRKADKLARKFLSEAKKNLGSQKEFYIAMERALHNYLKAKLNIQTGDMSKDRITRLLKEREVDESTNIEFIGLLESCEFARYTPSNTVAMQQDYDKAVRVISTMDKQL